MHEGSSQGSSSSKKISNEEERERETVSFPKEKKKTIKKPLSSCVQVTVIDCQSCNLSYQDSSLM